MCIYLFKRGQSTLMNTSAFASMYINIPELARRLVFLFSNEASDSLSLVCLCVGSLERTLVFSEVCGSSWPS